MNDAQQPAKSRMYVLIRESVPTGFAVLAAAHASLAAYLEFADAPEVTKFAKAKETPDHIVITESAMDGQEVAIAFRPRAEYPKAFRFFKLFK